MFLPRTLKGCHHRHIPCASGWNPYRRHVEAFQIIERVERPGKNPPSRPAEEHMADVHATLVHDIYVAEEELSKTEASLRLVEARLNLTDAAMARVRQLGARLGLRMSPSPATSSAKSPKVNVSMKTLAERTGVCERTCAKIRKAMTEGVHFHRVGTRILFHDPEAIEFVEKWSMRPSSVDVEQAVNDDVLRRRARVALARVAR